MERFLKHIKLCIFSVKTAIVQRICANIGGRKAYNMKIGVISDTHVTDLKDNLPEKIYSAFSDVDHIIHCGDFVNLRALELLEEMGKPVHAVCGNMDSREVCERFPEKEILDLEGVRIGIYHGCGDESDVASSVQRAFENDEIDAYVFGHTHQAVNVSHKGKLYFNPGSASEGGSSASRSVGILTIENKHIKGEIVELS